MSECDVALELYRNLAVHIHIITPKTFKGISCDNPRVQPSSCKNSLNLQVMIGF